MNQIRAKISELRIAEEKASPAPWIRNHNGGHIAFRPNPDGSLGDFHYAIIRGWNHEIADNSNFIALARNHLPEVLDYIERLEKVVGAAEKFKTRSNMRYALGRFPEYFDVLKALAALRKETK